MSKPIAKSASRFSAPRAGRSALALALAALGGCSDDAPPAATPAPDAGATVGCKAGERAGDGGGGAACIAAGLPADAPCEPGNLQRDDGSCAPAGVPPDGCAAGFEHDGDRGCEPILPAAKCPAGSMAVPGESTCHEPSACGAAVWGDIPVDATTQYVDAAYSGGGSDGSAAKPWTTIGDAIAAAAPGAIVAVAEGSYVEDVEIQSKPLRLWGRCASLVEIVAASAGFATLAVLDGADGTEIRGVALRGAGAGLLVSGSQDVSLDGAWIHDNDSRGVSVEAGSGATALVVRGSLVEHNHGDGVFAAGAELDVEGSVVRDTLPLAGKGGEGVTAFPELGAPAVVSVAGSLVENNRESGVLAIRSEVEIRGSVVRDTAPNSQGVRGWGVHAQSESDVHSKLTVVGSLFERNHRFGVHVLASDATVETTVVRSTLADDDGKSDTGYGVLAEGYVDDGGAATLVLRSSLVEDNRVIGVAGIGAALTLEGVVARTTQSGSAGQAGAGVTVSGDPAFLEPTTLTVRGCVVEGNHEAGIGATGAATTVDSTVVRGTDTDGAGRFGVGIVVQSDAISGTGTLAVTSSLLEDNRAAGVLVIRSQATVESSVVRRTRTDGEGFFGRGVQVEGDATPASVALLGVLLEDNHDAAVFAFDAQASVEASVLRATAANDTGALGDGVVVASSVGGATASVVHTRIEHGARSGVSSFGGAVTLGDSELVCQPFDLMGATYLGHEHTFADLGGNTCGCPEPAGKCVETGAGAEAPQPIGGLE